MTKLMLCVLFVCGIMFNAQAEKKPAKELKGLIVTGGCCHDYKNQQNIVGNGLAERINLKCDVLFEMKADKMKEALSKPDWHKGYDLIIYNFCHAHETDKEFVESVAKVHYDGKPAIALHCTFHTYHWKIKPDAEGKKAWTQLVGVTSPNHGPHTSIKVVPADTEHPIMKGFPSEWITPKGELYNIKEIHDNTHVLAMGTRTEKGDKAPNPCIWTNTYGKGKVVGITLGHHNETMQDKVYMDLLSRSVLWVTGNLK
ncbi:MAG: ThuA domain-containing protein [Lentisphaeraceae bacterium]|nr:ThuA domain-containing protein [Lentisphaeraceae bacterium]